MLPASAAAEVIQPWTPCVDKKGVECATVRVPKDRAVPPAAVVPGTLDLHVERIPARGARTGVLLTLVGGPGQSGSAFTKTLGAAFGAPLAGRDVVVIDTRGTGESGFLRCPGLDSAETPDALAVAVRGCQSFLGASSSLYTSRDSSADIEQVRSELLGVDAISIYGVSYGTKLALNYATAHPANVDRLILDSVVLPEGEDLLERSSLANVRRILSEQTCGRKACRSVTTDVSTALAAVTAQLTRGPISGRVRNGFGGRRKVTIDRSGFVGMLVAGDFDPSLRLDLPAALVAAAAGDSGPLLRLYGRFDTGGGGGGQPSTSTENSSALFVADLCEESVLPWNRTTPEAGRQPEIDATIAAVDEATIAPFTRAFLTDSDSARICRPWGAAATAPIVPAPPDVPPLSAPILILSGASDMRTPLSDAQALAARYPTPGQVTLLQAPGGHSVISNESADCARKAVGAFLASGPVAPCGVAKPELAVAPLAPAKLAAVKPARQVAGARGRVLAAVELTLHDAARANIESVFGENAFGVARVGGLRGGSIKGSLLFVALRDDSYVPGVRVSGSLGAEKGPLATLKVRGAMRGDLTVANDGRVRGVLDGKPVKTRFRVTRSAKGWLRLLDRA